MKKLIFILLLLPFISCTSNKTADVGIDSLITLRENEKGRNLELAKAASDQIAEYDLKKGQGLMTENEYKVAVDPYKSQLEDMKKLLDSTELEALKDHQKVY